MKRVLTIISILLGAAVLINAQPTLTYENNAPIIGDIYYQSYSQDPILPGPQGPNKTWDFSDISVFETGDNYAIDPATTPFADIFSQSNVAFNYNSTLAYHYSEITQDESLNWGVGFDDAPVMVIYYDDPVKQLEYPFSYLNEYTDMYTGDYEYQEMYTKTTGVLTKKADAWGTITTPAGTFENVLRLKTIRDHIDSVWMGDIFISQTVISYKDYEWFTADSHIPVFAITITNSLLVNDTVSYFVTGTTNVDELSEWQSSLQIAPNPASQKLEVSYHSNKAGEICISIVDLHGREIIQEELYKKDNSQIQNQFNISNLMSGIYFVKVVQDNQVEVSKFIVN